MGSLVFYIIINYLAWKLYNILKIHIKKDLSMTGLLKNWGGRTRTSEMAVPKTAALPLGDTPLLGTFLLYILKINCQ